jgi:DNA-binding Lrp family transcriptional regulator
VPEVLDLIDSRIIEALQRDGRMLYRNIARIAGVSLPTVRARIKRMMELGVIRKFTVDINPEGFQGKFRAIILLKVRPGRLESVVKELSVKPEIREIHKVLGEYNLVLKVEAKDLELLTRYTESPDIDSSTVLAISSTAKEEYGVIVEPNTFVQFRCEFCHMPIYGKPITRVVDGVRYYFGADECVEAFLEKRGRR